jgi:hypothetical protein
MPVFVLLRFHRWDEILALPEPRPELAVSNVLWRYARAAAFAARGKSEAASLEQQAFEALRKKLPAEARFASNPADKVLDVAAAVLEARLARDPKSALAHWQRAVRLQDALAYGEPEDWFYPVRESLGAALLRNGQAAEAATVFQEDLRRHRRNGRSLFGLLESLKAQKQTEAARWVRLEFERAWVKAVPLRLEDF